MRGEKKGGKRGNPTKVCFERLQLYFIWPAYKVCLLNNIRAISVCDVQLQYVIGQGPRYVNPHFHISLSYTQRVSQNLHQDPGSTRNLTHARLLPWHIGSRPTASGKYQTLVIIHYMERDKTWRRSNIMLTEINSNTRRLLRCYPECYKCYEL